MLVKLFNAYITHHKKNLSKKFFSTTEIEMPLIKFVEEKVTAVEEKQTLKSCACQRKQNLLIVS